MNSTHESKDPSKSEQIEAKHIAIPVACALIAWILYEVARSISNAELIWLILMLAALPTLFCLAGIVNLVSIISIKRVLLRPIILKKASLAVFSFMLMLTLFEAFLQHQAKSITFDPNNPRAKRPTIPPLTMPIAWERRPAEVDKAVQAYYWHGHLHAHSGTGMRLVNPPPQKRDDVFRIIVVGDSFTYGVGVPFKATYSSILQQMLEKDIRVEVLNLGIPGKQSEDIDEIVRFYTPSLKPDMIVYGVCLNDYLPSGMGEGPGDTTHWLPLPNSLQKFLIDKTRVGRFFAEGWYDFLLLIGWEKNFISQITDNYSKYRQRFQRDMNSIKEFVTENDLPPVVAMVLYQSSRMSPEVQELISSTEKILEDARIFVMPSSGYLEKFEGRNLRISAWDAHPNSTAHRLYAKALYEAILGYPKLSEYARQRKQE